MYCWIHSLEDLKPALNARALFFFICFGFTLSIIFIKVCMSQYQHNFNHLTSEALQNVANDFRYAETYKKLNRRSNLKYILIWNNQKNNELLQVFPEESGALISMNCSVVNCYFTTNKDLFSKGLQKFDGIVFNGHMLPECLVHSILNPNKLPDQRWPHQKYIFMTMESPVYYPVCNKHYDGYFNMTVSHKLDSDLPYTYMLLKNSNGDIVGPNKDMEWIEYDFDETDNITSITQNKSKAAAWFVSNCIDKSGRKVFANNLNKALRKYGYSIDVYGKCGPFKCSRTNETKCNIILERDYYFYLSLENSFAEDYVTEKLLTALQNNVIPIVYGGADYTKFLPPHSYLDGRKQPPEKLAELMHNLISDPVKYQQYFWWKKYYSYHRQTYKNMACSFCARLNDEEFMGRNKVYKNFRKWWNQNNKKDC